MGIEALFSGNALRAVDAEGRTILPPFVLRVLERRCAGPNDVRRTTPTMQQRYDAAIMQRLFRHRAPPPARRAGNFDGRPHSARASRRQSSERSMIRRRVTLPDDAAQSRYATAPCSSAPARFEVWDPDLARASRTTSSRVAEFATQTAKCGASWSIVLGAPYRLAPARSVYIPAIISRWPACGRPGPSAAGEWGSSRPHRVIWNAGRTPLAGADYPAPFGPSGVAALPASRSLQSLQPALTHQTSRHAGAAAATAMGKTAISYPRLR